MACAYAGREQRAAQAAQAVDAITWLGTAGHVLDFDDTYLPGIAHLSAPTAPAAIVIAARFQATIGEALEAYAAGFEAMGALSRSHRLYDGGWHPTAVCGAAGAAVVTARILGPGDEATAVRLALLQAGGLRAAFGSDGKSLQVGMAAAAGVQAGMLAVGGAVDLARRDGRAGRLRRRVRGTGRGRRPTAIDENWIKPWPCCLMSHSAIEAATRRTCRRRGDRGHRAPGRPPCRRVRRRRRRAAGEVLDPLPRRVGGADTASRSRRASTASIATSRRSPATGRASAPTTRSARPKRAAADGDEVARVAASLAHRSGR